MQVCLAWFIFILLYICKYLGNIPYIISFRSRLATEYPIVVLAALLAYLFVAFSAFGGMPLQRRPDSTNLG